MSYRVTKRQREIMAAMRAAKERQRLMGEPVERPPELPELRRRIVITDYDHGEVTHEILMYRTNRIDTYRVVADGVEWKERIGWSRLLVGLRKSMPRTLSHRSI